MTISSLFVRSYSPNGPISKQTNQKIKYQRYSFHFQLCFFFVFVFFCPSITRTFQFLSIHKFKTNKQYEKHTNKQRKKTLKGSDRREREKRGREIAEKRHAQDIFFMSNRIIRFINLEMYPTEKKLVSILNGVYKCVGVVGTKQFDLVRFATLSLSFACSVNFVHLPPVSRRLSQFAQIDTTEKNDKKETK